MVKPIGKACVLRADERKTHFFMKTRYLLFALALMPAAHSQETGQDFSLEGALAMFKKSDNLEAFEKALNEESNHVNNLDLNDDGKTDYITVTDIKEGDTHAIVLSTYLSEKEKQDIATIGIEKTGSESAMLQIEGDETLFGADAIAEPQDVAESSVGGKGGPEVSYDAKPIVVNVWVWPAVRFIYAPGYVVWVSPWRWAHYPRWWRPWRPVTRTVFVASCAPHRVYYHRVTTRRVVVARRVYAPRRQSSTLVVHNRRGTTVVHKNRKGDVKAVKTTRKKAKSRR